MADILFLLQQPSPAQAPTPPAAPAAPAAPTEAAPATVAADGGDAVAPGRYTIIKDGKTVIIDPGVPATVATTGDQFPFANPQLTDHVFSLAKDAVIGLTLVIIAFPLFGFLKALVTRRANTAALALPRESTERLERIERAVEAMAVEVERISEGQRFVTKALSERVSIER